MFQKLSMWGSISNHVLSCVLSSKPLLGLGFHHRHRRLPRQAGRRHVAMRRGRRFFGVWSTSSFEPGIRKTFNQNVGTWPTVMAEPLQFPKNVSFTPKKWWRWHEDLEDSFSKTSWNMLKPPARLRVGKLKQGDLHKLFRRPPCLMFHDRCLKVLQARSPTGC